MAIAVLQSLWESHGDGRTRHKFGKFRFGDRVPVRSSRQARTAWDQNSCGGEQQDTLTVQLLQAVAMYYEGGVV